MWSAAVSVTPAPWNLCSRREAPRAAQGNVPSGTAGGASQDIGVPFRCDTGCVAVAKTSIRRDFRPHAAAKRSGDAGAPQSPAPAAFDLNGETKMARADRRSPSSDHLTRFALLLNGMRFSVHLLNRAGFLVQKDPALRGASASCASFVCAVLQPRTNPSVADQESPQPD
jgi:hypothetical protein